jgi:hypothetical protein
LWFDNARGGGPRAALLVCKGPRLPKRPEPPKTPVNVPISESLHLCLWCAWLMGPGNVPNCVQTGHPGLGMMRMLQKARGQLLFYSFPLEAGFCHYIAGPALSASAIARALLPKPLFTRVRGRGVLRRSSLLVRTGVPCNAWHALRGAQFGPDGMHLLIHLIAGPLVDVPSGCMLGRPLASG